MGRLCTIVFIFILTSFNSLFSQSKGSPDDKKLIANLDKKGWSLRKTYPDSTLYYTDKIITLLRASGDTSQITKYYNYKGIGYYYKGDNYTSYGFYTLAYEIAEALGDSIQFAHSMNNLGRFFASQGNYVKAFDFANKALKVFQKLDYKDGIAYSQKRISEVYLAQGYFDKALKSSKKALGIRLNYFDKNDQATAHIDLAAVYLSMDSLDNSQSNLMQAKTKAMQISNEVLIATSELGLSEIHIKLNQYDSAILYAQKAKDVALSTNNQDLLNQSLVQLGKSLYHAGKLLESKNEFEEVLKRSIDSNQLELERNAYYYLARINASLGKGMKAYEYQLQYDGLDEQLNNTRDKRAIDSLLFKDELRQRAKENELLIINKEKDQKLIQTQKWVNIIMIIFVITILVILILLYRFSRKTERANQLLSRRNSEIISQKEEINAILENKEELEEELLNSNQRLESILNSGYVSIITTTTEGLITHFSKGAENLLGYRADEMVGINSPAIIHDELEVITRGKELTEKFDKEIVGFRVFVELADRHGFESREWTYIKKNGDKFPVQLVVSALKNKNGESVGYLGIATDISQQKEIENKLRVIVEENEHYKDILENVEDLIYELDNKAYYSYVNPATCRLSGYKSEELKSMHYLDLVVDYQKEEVKKFYKNQLLSKTKTTSNEFIIKNKSGKEIWLRQSTTMFFDEQENLIRILAVAQNIDEIHELRSKLEAQFDLYKLVSENSQDLIALHDLDATYRYVSPSVKNLLGYEPEELIGKNPYELIHPEDQDKLKKGPHSKILKGISNANIQYRLKDKLGNYVWFESYNTPVFGEGGKIVSFQTSSRDIREKKREEEKINRYQRGLRLINSLSASINDDIDELFESSLAIVSDYLNLPLGIISKIDGDQYLVRNFYSKNEAALERGQQFDFKNTYCHITYSNNSVISISEMNKSEYKGHPCYQNFNLESYIGSIIYVENKKFGTVNFSSPTPRNEHFDDLDEDFMVLYANWIGANIQRFQVSLKLKEKKEKAELATKAKADFLSVMSHEIRTPLNGILGLTNILLNENPRKNQLTHLNLLKFSGDNLLVIINDILDFNKIEAGKINLEKADFDLYSLCSSIRQTNEFKISEKSIDLILEYDRNLPKIFIGDSVRLGQVINNLVSNAIKFTDKGFVKIIVNQLNQDESGIHLKLSIQDTGKGINPKNHAKIFERFSQEDDSTTRLYGGTGLGLSISKRLLELMDSDIELESELGKGSVFSFKLKLPKGKKVESSTHEPLEFSSLKEYNLKILIADDNDVNYIIASNYLNGWGIACYHATDGNSAVRMSLENDYDLILMDLQMPNKNGYEASKELRSQKLELPIIALTASALEEIRIKAENAGMNEFLTKPINPRELYEKIIQLLNITIDLDVKSTECAKDNQSLAFENTLDVISKGDTSFKNELARLFSENLTELKVVYSQAINDNDVQKARDIKHKTLTALSMLELNRLSGQLKKGINNLEEEVDFDKENFIHEIHLTLDKAITELNAFATKE